MAVNVFVEYHSELTGNMYLLQPYAPRKAIRMYFWGTTSFKPEHAHIQHIDVNQCDNWSGFRAFLTQFSVSNKLIQSAGENNIQTSE